MRAVPVCRGFTLLELLLVLAMALVLASLAGPSLADMLAESRYQQTRIQLQQAYQYARSEAVKREQAMVVELVQQSVVVRPADSQTAYRRFELSLDGMTLRASNIIEITALGTATPARWSLQGPSALSSCLVVLVSGQAQLQQQACHAA